MQVPLVDNFPSDRLRRRDVKTLLLSALGGALEFYDFVVFVFFAIPLSHLFFPPDTAPWLAQLQVFGIFAAGYLARPLGGIVMAHYGDKLGRKRMFTLSVFLMAVPTLAIGLLPVYAQIGMLAPLLLVCCGWCRASRWAARYRARGCSWPSTCRRSGSVSPAPASPRDSPWAS
jgi:MFS family permease